MKLLKLVYIAHGWHLGLTNGEMLLPEGIEAWKYGPVIPSLYRDLRTNGSAEVTSMQGTGGFDSKQVIPQVQSTLVPFLDKIWDLYGHLDGLQLSALTHQENTPWSTTWHLNGGKDMMGAVIPNQLIRQHYQDMLAKANA